MILRIFYLCIIAMLCISCEHIIPKKKKTQRLDTIIDFTKVDTYPSFINCKKLIDDEKTLCFRNNIHNRITKSLNTFPFNVKDSLNEELLVILIINKKGKVCLQEIQSSDSLQKKLPNLIDYIGKSIDSLPKLSPAIKRGIPVTTQYKLPIKIKVN
ncbi:MAG: hypothetical protein KGV59_05840 [Tenacibaculum sp.]|nr:hypothetical protein [Tenacibaculum sp.]